MSTDIDTSEIQHLTLIAGVGDGRTTACVVSAASILAGLRFSDSLACTSGVVTRLCIHVNDGPYWRDDAERTAVLLPLAPRLIGTARPELEARRAAHVAAWVLRVPTARALRHAADAIEVTGLCEHAAALRGLATECEEAAGAPPRDDAAARAARDAAYAAERAAYVAARAAHDVARSAYAAYGAHIAARAAARAADDAADAVARVAADAAEAAARGARDAAYAAGAAAKAKARREMRDALLQLIDELIEMQHEGTR